MEIKNIHTHSSWYSSYEKSEQGKALIECQAKKIEQLTSLLENIKGEIELKEGDIVDVQMDGEHEIYKKDDGQLYFKPYGKEDRVSAYFSNDIIKVKR